MSRKRERDWPQESRSPPQSPAVLAAKKVEVFKDYFPLPTGDIDLAKYDLPQGRAPLEWWYHNCHLTSKQNGQRFSLFSSFFRQVDHDEFEAKAKARKAPETDPAAKATPKKVETPADYTTFYDACTWAISDVDSQEYYPDCLLDHRSCNLIVRRLDPQFTGRKTVHAETAVLELARKGRVPRPDRLMKKAAVIDKKTLSLHLDEDCVLMKRGLKPNEAAFQQNAPASAPRVAYEIHLKNPTRNTEAHLNFVPQQAVVRHGTNGVVNEMFYYYIPRMAVYGTLRIGTQIHEVEGSGWYDREFGGTDDVTGKDALDAWNWFSVQLSDGSEFSLFNVVDRDTFFEKEKVAVWTDSNGQRISVTDVQLTYKNMWTSLNTYIEYPRDWKIVVPTLGLELHLSTTFAHQEFQTILVTGGGFFEGRVTVTGTRGGRAVTGTGYLERKNHTTYGDTMGLLKNVGRFVKKTLAEMYPLDASQEWINANVLGRHCTGSGVDARRVCDTLFRPVRSLTDRGGKSWRSLILVSSVNALSDKYIDCSRYIAIAELLHVGSLIIDDIQDESSVRRGGKCVHLEYGTATAINSGTGCYFMAPRLFGIENFSPDKQVKLYALYFDALRSGHAGQGLDIAGLEHLMPAAVETGETSELYNALKAIHTYKTGGAAGTICAMACVICGATDVQTEAFDFFGTRIGLAFQIVDDALNLRGFEGDLKEVGEDIRDGKVTYPIIKALSRLQKHDRQYLWTVLEEKSEDSGKIASIIALLNSVAAIDDCLIEARTMVEEAWERLDGVVPDSLPKIMMRTFCTYLTERTY